MGMTKYASLESAQVLGIKGSHDRAKTASLEKFADFDEYRTEDGFLYARIRAISSRVNKNHDGWPSVELAGGQDAFDRISKQGSVTVAADKSQKYGYSTFLGKPVFVDHHNSDPTRARGVIVDAKLHVEDHKTAHLDPYYSTAPDNHLPPTWVELLLEVDAKSFPRLAKAIIEGSKDPHSGIDGFSMGCDVEKSVCSVCKNAAYSPDDYCTHIKLKGTPFSTVNPKTGKKELKKSYEDCFKISFFEISAVFDPADETALLRDVVHKEGAGFDPPIISQCSECEGTGKDPYNMFGKCLRCGGKGSQIRGDGGNGPESAPERDMSQFDVNNVTSKTASHDLPGYDAWKTTPPEPGPECPECGSTIERGKDFEECPVCGWGHGRDYDRENDDREWQRSQEWDDELRSDESRLHGASTHTAENPLPQADLLHAPEEVDTLRKEQVCPVCGSTMDSETCDICGYVEPPDGFGNPDLQKRQEEVDPNVQQGLEPDPEPTPTPGGDTTMATPDILQGRNPGPTASVRDDMAEWKVSVHPKIAGRINVTEQPMTTSTEPATDEPKEQILQDETKPTQRVRTAQEFIAAAGRGKEKNMAQKTAAEPVPAAKPDTHGEVEGTGGYIEDSNEAASKADAQVEVVAEGGTGVESVGADQESVSVAQGDEHSKNIEGTSTDTWSGTDGQTSPVGGATFPSDNGQGAGKWSMNRQAYDSESFPSEDGGLSGGTAVKGTEPVDPIGKADDRVDVLSPVTSPSNNSGPTTTWTGTDGNGVLRQQDPVTNESLEGSDLVNLSPGKVRSSTHIFSAIKLADLEVELGLLNSDEKYDRMAELEKQEPAVVQAQLDYASRVKTAGLKRQVKQAHRLPSFAGSTVSQQPEKVEEVGDEGLFLR